MYTQCGVGPKSNGNYVNKYFPKNLKQNQHCQWLRYTWGLFLLFLLFIFFASFFYFILVWKSYNYIVLDVFFWNLFYFGKYLCFTNNEEQIHAANNLFIYSIKIERINATKRAGCETDDCSNSENFLLSIWHMIFFFLTIIVQQICFNPRNAYWLWTNGQCKIGYLQYMQTIVCLNTRKRNKSTTANSQNKSEYFVSFEFVATDIVVDLIELLCCDAWLSVRLDWTLNWATISHAAHMN